MNVTLPVTTSALGMGTLTVAVSASPGVPSVVAVGAAAIATVVGAIPATALTRLNASIDPSPDAQSYPASAGNP